MSFISLVMQKTNLFDTSSNKNNKDLKQTSPSSRYQDYVIKGRKLIGKFEEMYQNCDDPWEQDQIVLFAEDLALFLIEQFGPYEHILDLGCGKGRLTNRLHSHATSVTVLDTSKTAIKHAKNLYDKISFQSSEIPPIPFKNSSFDLICCFEILWYLLENLDFFFSEIQRVLTPEGHLLILLNFLPPGQQTYGLETLKSPSDLLGLLPFKIVHFIELDPQENHKAIVLVQNEA